MVEKEACHWSAIIGNKILRVFKRKRLMGGHIWGKAIKEVLLRKGRAQKKGERLGRKTDMNA